jgi:[acyl-carrier-protein] S-malonyltransferase
MKIALLFPGQGSQRVGMGADLAKNFTVAKRAFEEADDALGFAISRLCFDGPEEDLRLTANTQPALVTVAIAALRALRVEAPLDVAFAAGHSLGEYSALVAAGSLTFSTDGRIVVPANLNAPGQIVVAGHTAAVRRAVELARERGSAMAVELKVSAPFHSPLMAPARAGMEKILAAIDVAPLNFGVIANVTAEINLDGDRVRPLLLEQITAPVRWEESMQVLARTGIAETFELGCGKVLAGLMRRIERNVKVRAVEDVASVKVAVAALAA